MNPDRHHNALNQGDRLHWYEIERILGHGGFGITYLALDTNLNHKVAIKEYLPVQFATRATTGEDKPISDKDVDMFEWGKKRFLDEARTLFPFKHPNIVRVLSFFEFNETGYIVMEYVEGVDLADLIKAGEPFSEGELLGIINPILEGLSQVHEQGFIHRDIKPRNIVIREDGSPVLIDFGSARQALGEQTHTLTSLVTPGYSPLEQYHGASGNQGPWTDIYALGATLYAAATGRAPIDSMMRNAALTDNKEDPYQSLLTIVGDKYSRSFLVAIDHAMRFAASQRPQTLAEWADELSGEHTTRLADEQITATPDYLDREPVLQGGKPVGQVPLEPEKPRVNKGHKQVVILLVLLAIGVFTYPQWVNIPTDLGTNLEPVLKDERMVTDKTDQESASVDVIPLEPPVPDTPADDVSSEQRIETASAAKPIAHIASYRKYPKRDFSRCRNRNPPQVRILLDFHNSLLVTCYH